MALEIMIADVDIENLEVDLLLTAIFERYGYDFRHYARASLMRRIRHRMLAESIETISELLARMLHDTACFERLLSDLSISVTEMFRDPAFFKAIRDTVVPVLRTYPFAKIWHAGCATGEEVYSMAIVLHEEGLLSRTQIYATDINRSCLATARQAIYGVDSLGDAEKRYTEAGGKASFGDYCHTGYGAIKIREELCKPIVFAHHNLAVDHCFGEMNLVVCRNVMIYFDRKLQDRVVGLFHESLCHRGFLGLGPKESLRRSGFANAFESTAETPGLYRRVD